tara:strand:+ start:1211 stop:1432 length:222 start_codon:yes stop_codon:yes gene_type:complete
MAKRSMYSDMNRKELFNYRNEKGWSQQRMSDELGLSLRQYRYYELGDRKIPLTVEKAFWYIKHYDISRYDAEL